MTTSKKNLLLLSFMLFSMFFGAGNLIFPPFVGQMAGQSMLLAMIGFLITAVGFPVLGIAVIARFNGLNKLADKVHPKFSLIFTILIYLSIGPLLAIPRAATLPFEMAISPYITEWISPQLGLLIFSVLFFAMAWWLSANPTKLVDLLGKILTPILLILIFGVFVAGIINPLGQAQPAQGAYQNLALITGFLDGYQTMDALAALSFGIVVAVAVRSLKITNEKEIMKTSIYTGCFAGLILAIIYLMLAYLGASISTTPFGANGAFTLTYIVTALFGQWGAILLAAIFFLACITTCVGLLTSCSEYFSTLTKNVKYKHWLAILSIFAMLVSNVGLNQILSFSVPILSTIYPIALVIILLGLFEPYYHDNRFIFPITIAITSIISIVNVLDTPLKIQIPLVTAWIAKLPYYEQTLGWVSAAIVAVILSLILAKLFPSKTKENSK